MNPAITRPTTPFFTPYSGGHIDSPGIPNPTLSGVWDSDIPVDIEAWLEDMVTQGKKSLENELRDLGPRMTQDDRRRITHAYLTSVGEIRDLARKQYDSLREEERFLQMWAQGQQVPENIRAALQNEQQRKWDSLVSDRAKTPQPNRSRTVSRPFSPVTIISHA
jgi:hypothetical protein